MNLENYDITADLESITQNAFQQYVMTISEYVISINKILTEDTSNEYINSLTKPNIDLLINQMDIYIDFFVEWDLWPMFEIATDTLNKIKNK